jgi:hypothetical protein
VKERERSGDEMKPALDLVALAQTWSDWLNGDDVSPEEQDGDVVFTHLKLAASGLLQPRIHEHRFKESFAQVIMKLT